MSHTDSASFTLARGLCTCWPCFCPAKGFHTIWLSFYSCWGLSRAAPAVCSFHAVICLCWKLWGIRLFVICLRWGLWRVRPAVNGFHAAACSHWWLRRVHLTASTTVHSCHAVTCDSTTHVFHATAYSAASSTTSSTIHSCHAASS